MEIEWLVVTPRGPTLRMTGWETPQLPLRGARGSAARFPVMTLVCGLRLWES